MAQTTPPRSEPQGPTRQHHTMATSNKPTPAPSSEDLVNSSPATKTTPQPKA